MAAPTRKTNPEYVRDCVVWLLGRISWERNDFCDGIVVRKCRDPRQIATEASSDDFKQKHRLLSVRIGERARQGQQSIRNNKRQVQRLELIGLIEQTEEMDEQGLTLDDVRERIAYDVTWNFQGDQTLDEAAAALGIDPKPSCTALEVDRVMPLVPKHPYGMFVIQCSYAYEDRPFLP